MLDFTTHVLYNILRHIVDTVQGIPISEAYMAGLSFRQIANVLALIFTIVINGLANALPLNGLTTGEVSDGFPIFFVPAGYVFSIWGVIYLALIGFAIYQVLPAQRDNPRLQQIGYLFVLTNVLNAAWIFMWHYQQFPLTLVLIVALLVTLIVIYLKLGIGRFSVSPGETWFVRAPFSIYLGWLTVATIANASQLLYWLGWNGTPLSGQAWAAIMLAVAVVLAGIMAWTRRDFAYLLVLVWAFAGIGVKHSGEPLVTTAAWIATAAAAALAAWSLISRSRLPRANGGSQSV